MLAPLFTAGGHFHVLALGRNHVRLFRGTTSTFDELGTPGIPQSVNGALKYDVREVRRSRVTVAAALAVLKTDLA